MMKKSQDDAREIKQISLFKLEKNPSRVGCDATDEVGREFEVKTSTKGSFSTFRLASEKIVNEHRTRHYIFSDTFYTPEHDFVFDKTWYISPEGMSSFWNGLLGKIQENKDTIHDVIDWEKFNTLSEKKQKLISTIIDRGTALNDPQLSKKYVENIGIELHEPYDANLRRVLKDERQEGDVPHELL